MKLRAFIASLCLISAAPLGWADAGSKAAKIAELVQIAGVRQHLHEVDGKLDQEAAVRAWARAYSESVTEAELDTILAYYRSPAGQKDVSASRAALTQAKNDTREKHAPFVSNTPAAAGPVVAPPPEAPRASVPPVGDVGSTSAAPRAPGGDVEKTPAARRGPDAPSTGERSWDSAPHAPDGLVVPSPSSPERCEVSPTSPTGKHASGRSVVCVCTDEKGKLTRDPVIAESSGDPRVDSGALKMARIDSGRYIPPTVNGQPQNTCFRFAIDFSHHP